VLGLLVTDATVAAQSTEVLELMTTIGMPGVRGRIDHLDVDLPARRLFVAALGNNTVEIIDVANGRISDRLGSVREPQGVRYVPGAGKLFVANGGGGITVFSGEPLRSTGSIDGLEDADNVRLDQTGATIYVGYGHALAVVDVGQGKISGRIPLAGHPESFQLDSNQPRAFVNVPSASQVAVIDLNKKEQIAVWTVGDAAANYPMALDAAHHRLFIGTRRPARVLVYDAVSGKVVATLPIGGDVDDLFYDAARQQIYAVCGEGLVSVIKQRGPNEYEDAGNVKTAIGARTGLFVPDLGVLYVAVPARGGLQAEIRAYAAH
jgi:DNA-binding beta-propeller fold protein YncE